VTPAPTTLSDATRPRPSERLIRRLGDLGCQVEIKPVAS
jgi:hypothetical protein